MAADASTESGAVPTGEEDERLVWKQRCKLYRFHDNQWKQRGTGEMTFLQHESSRMVRMVMRQDKTYKVVLNHYVAPTAELKINFGNDRSRVWSAIDFSDNDKEVMTFATRFAKSEEASDFESTFNKAKVTNGEQDTDKKEELPKWVDPYSDEAPAKVDVTLAKDEAKSDEPPAKDDKAEVAKSPGGVKLWKEILEAKQYSAFAEDDLKKLWRKYDKDHSEQINHDELRDLYRDLMDALFEKLEAPIDNGAREEVKKEVDAMVEETISRLDADHNNKLSWSEFKRLTEIKLL